MYYKHLLHKLLLCFVLLLCARFASAQLTPRAASVAPESAFVPVDLNALANDASTRMTQTPSAQIDFGGVPFDLARRDEKNNLFLHEAGWPKWKEDPLDYYSPYDSAPEAPTAALPVVQIPTDDYAAVYALVSCENDAKFSNVLSFRIGAKRGFARTRYHDFEFRVPRANEATGENVVSVLPGAGGNMFLLRLPLHAALRQEFGDQRALDVEITKQIRLSISKPDAARFQYRPLGLPSGVHVYGLTFERSSLRFSADGSEIGNVFNDPQIPSFDWQLNGVTGNRPKEITVRARATDLQGNVTEFPAETLTPGSLSPMPTYRRTLRAPVPRRGYYVLDWTIEGDGNVLLTRRTTFARLPKNTRQFRNSSPFGTWDFGGTHYTPDDAEMVGPLYVKAGLRYGMFGYTPEQRKRYGVIKGNDPVFNSGTDISKIDEQLAAAKAQAKASGETPAVWMLFHEDGISGAHVTRTPDLFTGKTYKLNAEEQANFDKMKELVRVAAPKIRRAFPGIRIYLGNGVPHLMEEFLRSGVAPENFDALGNEGANFQRLPESQPTDFVANNASLWMEHELLRHYKKYSDKTVTQAYEIGYPSSNPGNLTLRQQAAYVVRNSMHSLAWKVPIIRFEGIADPGNSYYFGNWGGTGLMFDKSDLSPKPLFVAVATMTQQLDGAKFSRVLETGSAALYAFEFKKPNGSFVTCLWTPNAPRDVRLSSSSSLLVTDLMSNARVLAGAKNGAVLRATFEPVFVESARPLQLRAAAIIENEAPPREYSQIAPLDDASQWRVENGENVELEAYNFMQPRLAGTFSVKNVAAFEGERASLEVTPPSAADEKWWLPRYTRLEAKTPIAIAGEPTRIGLMVNGNSGWGRIIFELKDAANQRWISIGTEQNGAPNPWLADWMSKEAFANLKGAGISDWNSNDVWGRSMINFDGWRFLQFPLPGNYPGEGYHWPYTSQWRCVKEDGSRGDYIVHYPLQLSALAVTARSRVLYGSQVQPVKRPEIYLKNLSVASGDPDKVFWQPDLGQR